jgi:uncharacterized linocin/CFP29 family protein
MTDFRSRDAAPLSPEEWRAIDLAAQDSARGQLVGRRFLALFGPVGPGMEYIEQDRLGPPRGAIVSMEGEEEADEAPPLAPVRRRALPLPLLYRDARVYWRDLERTRQTGIGLDLSGVVAAAAEVAAAEDRLIFQGDARLGIEGLLTTPDSQGQVLGDWTAPGDAYAQIARATAQLLQAGHPGPYALVLSPERWARLERVSDLTGTLELVAVERLLRGPVLPSPFVDGGVLLDPSSGNMDLALGIDLSVAYADSEHMNHRLRVLETVVPRVKRPSAILRLDPQK